MPIKRWDRGRPSNFQELFEFYDRYVKVLYSSIQTQNTLPVETLFELDAAFDHISRHWAYDESEADVVEDAFGHLKRSCLDIFKLKYIETRDQYDALNEIDTSIIDNGEYNRKRYQLFHTIKLAAIEARQREGEVDAKNLVPAFELWEDVFVNCETFEIEFFLHPKLTWAKKKGIAALIRQNFWGFWLGVLASLLAALLLLWFGPK